MELRDILSVTLLCVFLVLGTYIASAASGCPVKVDAKSTSALIAEVPAINTALQSCPTAVPSQLSKLIKNGVLLLEISDADDISANITNGNATGVSVVNGSSYAYKITLSSCQLDNILSKQNPAGAFAAYYLSGKANLGASGFVNKVKLWFGKLFIKPAFKKIQVDVEDCTGVVKEESKKPSNCFETYMPGYEEYSNPETKKVWDQRFAETGHVCQTQTAAAPSNDGKCKYTYEQIKNNDKKWVCWY